MLLDRLTHVQTSGISTLHRNIPIFFTLFFYTLPPIASAGALDKGVALGGSSRAIGNSTKTHIKTTQAAASVGARIPAIAVPGMTSPPGSASCAPNCMILLSDSTEPYIERRASNLASSTSALGPYRYESSSAAPRHTLAVPVFDALGYTGKPNTIALGLRTIHLIDRNPDQTAPPNEASVRQQVAEISQADPSPVIVFDIETPEYPFDTRSASTEAVDKTLVYFGQLIDWTRNTNPNAKIGFYGILPICDYWSVNLYHSALYRQHDPWWRSAFATFQKRYTEWQNANAYLASLVQKVDYLFPSLYTFYDSYESDLMGNDHGWKDYALLSIEEARKYNKTVYPFIWPQFHEGGTYKDYRYLPPDYWEKEIIFLRNHADGMVLWGWSGFLHETWSDNAPWWQMTLKSLLQNSSHE